MRMLALAAALALSACAALPSAPPAALPAAAPPGAVDRITISGTKGLLLANYLYQSIGTPVAVAIERGVITGPLKLTVQAADRDIIAALRDGRAAQSKAVQAKHAAEALRLLDRISALTGIPLPTL